MFEERKAAQAAAFFVQRNGGTASVLKLIKLLYLADRQSIDLYGHPITFDSMVSMPHGPVLSQTYDLIQGARESINGGWDYWIEDREGRQVRLRQEFHPDQLQELSDADVDVLERVWAQFGHMTPWELRDYTHDHCPEWVDPQGSSNPITLEAVLSALRKPPQTIEAIATRLYESINVRRKYLSR